MSDVHARSDRQGLREPGTARERVCGARPPPAQIKKLCLLSRIGGPSPGGRSPRRGEATSTAGGAAMEISFVATGGGSPTVSPPSRPGRTGASATATRSAVQQVRPLSVARSLSSRSAGQQRWALTVPSMRQKKRVKSVGVAASRTKGSKRAACKVRRPRAFMTHSGWAAVQMVSSRRRMYDLSADLSLLAGPAVGRAGRRRKAARDRLPNRWPLGLGSRSPEWGFFVNWVAP